MWTIAGSVNRPHNNEQHRTLVCLKQRNVFSFSSRQVWTSTASGVRKKLSDECVTKIFKETKDDFKELHFGTGLIYLLKEYM